MKTLEANRHGFFPLFTCHENLCMMLLFVLLWSVVLAASGSLFSGYHLADDHEILTIQEDLLKRPSGGVFSKWFWHDFDSMHRFRPFYFAHRIFLTRLLGTNFTAWFFYTGILAVSATFLLYYGGRLTGFSVCESALFALLTLLGRQAVVWWSLGPNESIAMLLLSASWVCMLLAIRSPRSGASFRSVMVVTAVLAALSKENFVLLFPALIFLMAWTYRTEKKTTWSRSWTSNAPTAFVLLFFMALDLFIIGRSIGVDGYGRHGGGIDRSSLLTLFQTALDVTLSFSTIGAGWIILFISLAFMVLFWHRYSRKNIESLRTNVVPSLILFGLITVPQFMIYARCGIHGRYILPIVLGYAGLLVSLLRFLRINDFRFGFDGRDFVGFLVVVLSGFAGLWPFFVKRSFLVPERALWLRIGFSFAMIMIAATVCLAGFLFFIRHRMRCNKQGFSFYRFALGLTVLLVFYKMVLSFTGARAFAQHGRDTQAFFGLIEKHTQANDFTILVIDHEGLKNEAAYSIQEFLRIKMRRPCAPLIVAQDFTGFRPKVSRDKKKPESVSFVAVFSDLERDFLQCPPPWFHRSDYTRVQNGIFVSYFLEAPREADIP